MTAPRTCDHQWHWTGVEFACSLCSKPTSDEHALADLGEPGDDTTEGEQ